MSTAEQVTEPCAHHGEGPVWVDRWPGLRWVDMLAGDVLTLDERSGSVHRRHVGSVVAALRPCRDNGAVLALERGFALTDDDLAGVRPLPELWPDSGLRMNEGGCDPDGRFYCGSMAYAETPGAGGLYRLNPDHTVSSVLTGVTISNGLAWSPDGTTAYYVDTPTRTVDAFDYVDGQLSRRRTLVEIESDAGAPDGLTVDAEGHLWVALWGGGAVRRYTPRGELDEVVTVPVPRVTACTLGGPRLDELYITTSRVATDTTRHPRAGALFRIGLPVPGLPPLPYAPTRESERTPGSSQGTTGPSGSSE
ncbi:sugar lactone lactonase YvrE [Saccharopolyspora lacisalsi]|uniref:Sugar lactone lactonase YvrE n=1 Tax=Halosaccharopolyspora lacisalsi TaxID=1000566 RepID=A0A839DW81_9PSEU|nr:SMP-30/gluconolactonase/LRE family protein [Halosaccharopolyspora lacisalsi]MBA8825764.1 sugar lactone lactonase YvrE [Halosaccharopolyspora lacisalsi]